MQRMILVFPLRKPLPSQVDVRVTLANAVYLWFPTCPPKPSSSYHCPAQETREEPEGAEVRVGLEEHIWQVFADGEKVSL